MLRILIVDDCILQLAVTRSVLMDAGLDVVVCSNSVNAISIAKEYSPDLILLDLNMPLYDGAAVSRDIQSCPTTCDIPFVMFSSCSEITKKLECLNLGALDYLEKTINSQDLIRKVRAYATIGNTKKLR